MDIRTDKKKHMEDLFKENNITNYIRFSAITPQNFKERTNCNYEISSIDACLISHVYMCKYILDNINTEWTLILEDDIEFTSWELFEKDKKKIFNSNFNIIKVGYLIHLCRALNRKNAPLLIPYHTRKDMGTSTTGYFINKKGCRDICDVFFKNNEFVFNKKELINRFNLKSKDRVVADIVLYLISKTATLKYPLVNVNPYFESNLRKMNENSIVFKFMKSSYNISLGILKLLRSNLLLLFGSKDLFFAQKICRYANGYFVTDNETTFSEGINYLNRKEIDNNFEYIIVKDVELSKVPNIKNSKLIVIYDRLNEINKNINKFNIDLICVPTKELKEELINLKVTSKIMIFNKGANREDIELKDNPFNKEKTNLGYLGEITNEKTIYIKNLMNNLDDNFELHLNQEINLDLNNVKIHKSLDKHEILNNIDIGLVFPDKFTSIKEKEFNFEILDYCIYGLKCLSMDTINNSYLLNKYKNGIVIPYNSSPENYADNIKKLNKMKINKDMIIKKVDLECAWERVIERLLFGIFKL